MGQVCKRCIYDDRIPYITFDEEGICNYCRQHEQLEKEYPTGEEGRARLERLADRIRRDGRHKPYDVVVGVSGGCDSSYMLYLAKDLGLRPLAAHFDNTWNSKIAVENIHNVLERLKIDLFTHVVDNQEFNDIFRSFIKASVPDIETPADIGLATTHYLAARKYGIQYIFEGHSFRTEGISPHGWFYMDGKYIQTVHQRFGTRRMKTFPNLWMGKWFYWTVVKGIKKIRPLYYIDYRKEEVKKFLGETLGWKWYGGHHMENRTSYFTNNYYLPVKYNIDLRNCEFSALVRSGQLARKEALERIREPKPFDPDILEEVKKRLDLSHGEFESLMKAPRKTYRDYRTYKETFERLRWFFKLMVEADLVPKSFYMKYTIKYQNPQEKDGVCKTAEPGRGEGLERKIGLPAIGR
jgi:N-acetyl sugar amidotransferase